MSCPASKVGWFFAIVWNYSCQKRKVDAPFIIFSSEQPTLTLTPSRHHLSSSRVSAALCWNHFCVFSSSNSLISIVLGAGCWRPCSASFIIQPTLSVSGYNHTPHSRQQNELLFATASQEKDQVVKSWQWWYYGGYQLNEVGLISTNCIENLLANWPRPWLA